MYLADNTGRTARPRAAKISTLPRRTCFGRCSAAIEFRSYFVVARIAETKTTPQLAKPGISCRVRDNDRVRTGRAIFARRGTGVARPRRPGGAADRRRYRADADDEDRALPAAASGQPAGARAGAHHDRRDSRGRLDIGAMVRLAQIERSAVVRQAAPVVADT